MFLNISADQIICFVAQTCHRLPYQSIEKTFGPWFLELLNTYSPSNVYVLNGPWSFTTLRVCCLALTLIQQQQKNMRNLFSSTKPDFFSHLANTQHNFPSLIGMTIWQKKNCRRYTCATQQYEKISLNDRQQDTSLYIDHLEDINLIGWADFAARSLRFQYSNTGELVIGTQTTKWSVDFSAPCRHGTEQLTPAYLIDPTLG